jgi:hypothetical protein
MSHSSGVQVLAMTRDAFDLADQWAAHEGWIPGLRYPIGYFHIDIAEVQTG